MDGIVALGFKYHPQCFVCTQCGIGFSSTFVNVGGDAFHPECTPENVEVSSKNAVCDVCKELVLEGRTVRVGQKLLHSSCFKCFVCEQQIEKGSYDLWEGKVVFVTRIVIHLLIDCFYSFAMRHALLVPRAMYAKRRSTARP